MEKLRTSLTKTLKNLSDSLTEDACMEDMSDFVLSPHEAYSELDYNTSVLEIPKASQRPTAKIVLETEDDIINSIDASYFIEDDFDATGYELRKLFDTDLHIEDVDRECMCLKSQLQVVSKKISTLIMEKSPSYNAQIEDMDEIKDCIEELVRKIRAIRRSLLNAQSKSRAAMHILANEKKKRLLNRLLSTLRIIKTLYETEFHLKDCIEGGNFPMAIRLCLEAKEAANTYCHFSCVSDLMTKLVGFTNLIENSLDDALATCAIVFDQDQYVLVYSAFIMLNKVELASKKLISHFITTLKNSSRKIVEDRFLESNPAVGNAELSYEELCEHINTEDLVTTVRELGYVMCKILIFYHSILRFHVEDDERRRLNNTVEDGSIGIVANQMTFSLHAVFQVALSAMHSLLCCQNFSQLNFDQLLDIVFMVNRFQNFGCLFFGHSSHELVVSLERQAITYFLRYHSERMEELRLFLENECFTLCPVPNQFTIFDLQDFSFLEESRKKQENIDVFATNGDGEQIIFSPIPIDYINPFGNREIKSRSGSESTTKRPELLDDGFKKSTSIECEEIVEQVPNLCNTALSLLRFFGRYLRMTSLLPSIAKYSIPALTELFEYFFYAISLFFGSDGREIMEPLDKIQAILADIHDRIIFDETQSPRKVAGEKLKFATPKLCVGLLLDQSDQLYGIAERIVAVDSVDFVARQLNLVRPMMESLVPNPNEEVLLSLDNFYTNVLSVTPDMKYLVYGCVASRALDFPMIIAAVSNTRWDVSELQSHHSAYVDIIVKGFETLSSKIELSTKDIHLSDSVRTLLWDQTIYNTFKALVQGYSEGGKCSTEGRALMQLDFQHLQIKLEPICNLHPLPHCAFVEGYIKAFYLPENGLEEWVSKHVAYSPKQVISLLSVATHVSKKAKVRIMNALYD